MKRVAAYIGLGSNLGESRKTLRAAIHALQADSQIDVTAISHDYLTPAWGIRDQPDFINAAIAIKTTYSAPDLLKALHAIEQQHGRDRVNELRWGPRSLDLDILVYADERFESAQLHIPHPHLHERAFVLLPLAEIVPDLHIPGQTTVTELLKRVNVDAIKMLPR